VTALGARGAPLEDLVPHGVGQGLSWVVPVDLVAVQMQQRVELRQAEFAVAVQHGEAEGAQRAAEKRARLVMRRRQGRMVWARREPSGRSMVRTPQTSVDLAKALDDPAPLGGELNGRPIEFGQLGP
jgi:hypothetical protein